MQVPRHILPIIVIAQFFCTTLWFASNGVMSDLIASYNLAQNAVGHVTSAVQFGFIIGTFLFAVLNITDRFSPSKVFFISAILGAFCNLIIIFKFNTFISILLFRFATGFFLAGIYPVGMKIAADYFDKGLGKSLGFLVGALVLGTAFPHFLQSFEMSWSWRVVVIITSILAIIGGLLIVLLVGNGPHQKPSSTMDISMFFKVFKARKFKTAAFGYFGHMWELYTFWAFVPFLLKLYSDFHPETNFNIPLLSFLIIAVGGIACVISGYASRYLGAKPVARLSLTLSCFCCLLSPLFIFINLEIIFLTFLVFWGMVVIADSPLFSTLVAQNTIAESKGTALTIVNSMGFAITIMSIQLITFLGKSIPNQYIFMVLAVGPILGLIGLYKKEL